MWFCSILGLGSPMLVKGTRVHSGFVWYIYTYIWGFFTGISGNRVLYSNIWYTLQHISNTDRNFNLQKTHYSWSRSSGKFKANIYRAKARFYYINKPSIYPYNILCILRADYLWVETISSSRHYCKWLYAPRHITPYTTRADERI